MASANPCPTACRETVGYLVNSTPLGYKSTNTSQECISFCLAKPNATYYDLQGACKRLTQ